MMTTRRRPIIGPVLLATLGVAIMLVGLTLHWWQPERYALELLPVVVGASIAFAGFYAMDPKRAKDGGGFLVEAGTRIVGVIRTGSRASDPVVMVTKKTEPEPPAPAVEVPLDEMDIPPLAKIPASEKGQ